MKNLTCIVCPNGCHLQVEEADGSYIVHGSRCPRGEAFGKQEMISPMRTITSTVRTVFPEAPVVPVRVSGEIPKNRIFDVMHELNRVRLKQRLTTGDIVIQNVLGLGVDIIVTSNILKEDS